ncbi:MAG TPA: hypothetical protein VEW67_02000 [Thermoleophilaceae bacterium]|nr:hypothetical protein [Thermoleophilaceae bacterium]
MRGFLQKVAADRMTGERPAPPRALAAAVVAGSAVAAVTYRLLRREQS